MSFQMKNSAQNPLKKLWRPDNHDIHAKTSLRVFWLYSSQYMQREVSLATPDFYVPNQELLSAVDKVGYNSRAGWRKPRRLTQPAKQRSLFP